mmetsp:Transcript_50941/g.75558  ORF Transcript_50941/g.75558 Transcript_50941/m.75558 type:complete len:204 (+) Transcript_50941:162-773(+)
MVDLEAGCLLCLCLRSNSFRCDRHCCRGCCLNAHLVGTFLRHILSGCRLGCYSSRALVVFFSYNTRCSSLRCRLACMLRIALGLRLHDSCFGRKFASSFIIMFRSYFGFRGFRSLRTDHPGVEFGRGSHGCSLCSNTCCAFVVRAGSNDVVGQVVHVSQLSSSRSFTQCFINHICVENHPGIRETQFLQLSNSTSGVTTRAVD